MSKVSARATGLKRQPQPMPVFVKAALTKAQLMARYRERPPFQRNDYLMWISKAKLDATKDKRLSQMLTELRSGDAYMGMAWRARPKA